jgi:hypothetical protein
MDALPSRVFMNPNSQSPLDVLAGFDADFVAALEQQQADKLTAQELEALWSDCSKQHPRLSDLGHR